MTNGFYRRERLYRSNKGQSPVFGDVLPATLTLRTSYDRINHPFARWTNGYHHTPFEEVEIVPYHEAATPEMRAFIDRGIVPVQVGPEEFSERMFSAMVQAVDRAWDSTKFHVVMHSSGYDSRLISLAIKALYDRPGYGDKWLGKMIFVEADLEAENVRRLLPLEGWDVSRLVIYNEEETDPSAYHARSFDFKGMWQPMNGVSSYPVNGWWTPIQWLQKRGIIPGDREIQCFTGYGANETSKAAVKKYQSMAWYFWWVYYHQLSNFRLKGHWMHLFYDFNVLATLMTYCTGHLEELIHTGQGLSWSKPVVEAAAPELNDVPKITVPDLRAMGGRRVSAEIMKECMAAYNGSWYGRKVRPMLTMTNEITYSDSWGHYSLASFCEYILSTGRQIRL